LVFIGFRWNKPVLYFPDSEVPFKVSHGATAVAVAHNHNASGLGLGCHRPRAVGRRSFPLPSSMQAAFDRSLEWSSVRSSARETLRVVRPSGRQAVRGFGKNHWIRKSLDQKIIGLKNHWINGSLDRFSSYCAALVPTAATSATSGLVVPGARPWFGYLAGPRMIAHIFSLC